MVGELFNVSEQLQHKVIFIYFMSNVGREKKSRVADAGFCFV